MIARTSRWSTVAVVAALAALTGCDTAPTKPTATAAAAPVETRSATPAAAAAKPATPAAAPQSNVATVDLAKTAAGGAGAGAGGSAAAGAAAMTLPSQRVVYFDFDSYVIKDEYKGVVDGYARVLSANKGKKIVVEGHTDERGGSEYNLALGQKRAAAVAKNLSLLGVAESQVEAVSFGKERPVATGHDEAAWAKNRRAELKDR